MLPMSDVSAENLVYKHGFGLLIVLGGLMSAYGSRPTPKRYTVSKPKKMQSEKPKDLEEISLLDDDIRVVSRMDEKQYKAFKWNYLIVYALVMMSDWLQGPYIYALYRSFGFGVHDIAVLFVVGFLSSAIFGTLAGSVADKVGRKKMCLAFCIVYTISCITKFSPNFHILLFGRLTGGVATSLLFSVFEAWMVSEFHSRGFESDRLSDIFSWATFLNGLVAIASGILANTLVDVYGKTSFGYATPFMAAMGILMAAFVVIGAFWKENYGTEKNVSTSQGPSILDAVRHIRQNTAVLAVGSMQCFFESSMYTFVFMWSPTLESIKDKHHALPYGIIFASFMVSIMIGSIIFKSCVKRGYALESISRGVFMVAALSLAFCGISQNESLVFLAFNLFEICCGVYFPTMGTLRSQFIPESTRATVMNVFRVPLNLIVVISLLKVETLSRMTVFGMCAMLNGASFLFAGKLRSVKN